MWTSPESTPLNPNFASNYQRSPSGSSSLRSCGPQPHQARNGTHVYILTNIPESIRAYGGSDRSTDPLIAEEVEVITKQKAQVHPLSTPASYLFILKHKAPPISVFGFDPSKFLPHRPRITPALNVSAFITTPSAAITQFARPAVVLEATDNANPSRSARTI